MSKCGLTKGLSGQIDGADAQTGQTSKNPKRSYKGNATRVIAWCSATLDCNRSMRAGSRPKPSKRAGSRRSSTCAARPFVYPRLPASVDYISAVGKRMGKERANPIVGSHRAARTIVYELGGVPSSKPKYVSRDWPTSCQFACGWSNAERSKQQEPEPCAIETTRLKICDR